MFTTVLVPLDGSELALRSLPYACFIVRATSGQLLLLHAAPDRVLDRDPDAEVELSTDHTLLAERLRAEGVDAIARTVEGDAGPAVVRAAAEFGADLIAMSTHGRQGLQRALHGSVAEYVLRHSKLPVLAVSPNCDRTWETDRAMRILVPLDGSEVAEEALGPALEMAEPIPADLWLLRAVEDRIGINALGFAQTVPVSEADLEEARAYLERVATAPRQAGRTVTVCAEAGRPDDAIVRLAERDGIDLVVMATHGQGGLGRFLMERVALLATAGRVPIQMGSVAASCLQRLNMPVLMVYPERTTHSPELASPDGAPTVAPD